MSDEGELLSFYFDTVVPRHRCFFPCAVTVQFSRGQVSFLPRSPFDFYMDNSFPWPA